MQNKTPKGRNDSHDFDYSRINEQIYIGSDLCKGGVCKIHGEEFKGLGVSVELNLSAEENELPPKEIETYAWIPVVDGYAPSQEQFDMGTSLMHEAIKAGRIVYVHCKNGHGRSPTLVLAYLMRYENMSYDEGHALVKSKRPEIHVEKVQKEALNEAQERWFN